MRCALASYGSSFVLVMILVRGQRWRDALWLRPPSTATRSGGRLWLWALPFLAGFLAVQSLPLHLPTVAGHDFGAFLGSDAGHATLRGNWGLFAVIVVMFVFNTVLGEELLFRGLLLPRMRGAFGRGDWIANGVLFGRGPLRLGRWCLSRCVPRCSRQDPAVASRSGRC